MAATLVEAIETLGRAGSTTARGEAFEALMVEYLRTDPAQAARYDLVERWPDWGHNERSHDSGIDIVAREAATGAWTAIQCKYFAPTTTVDKSMIDSFLAAASRTWDGVRFANKVVISTSDRWTSTATEALENQGVGAQRIGMQELAASPAVLAGRTADIVHDPRPGMTIDLELAPKYSLRPHQEEALADIHAGFAMHDRGQWISACGTGKTFTSLKLAEQVAGRRGAPTLVVFLAPSIALVSQTLREWLAQTTTPIRPFVVCSDTKAAQQAEDISTLDMPLPTTDPAVLAAALAEPDPHERLLTVVFSTYQSIDVVARAIRDNGATVDLVLCDEAHRTTGVKLVGEPDESAFTKVHDNTFLPATKRLYMTATPRLYGTDVKKKAEDASAILTSMDDESVYGPVFHRLGFGEAVERKLLSDYKVMVLVVEDTAISDSLQSSIAVGQAGVEIDLDDAAKIVGCWNGLAKRTRDMDFGEDPTPMQRAVAFCRDIKTSKAFSEQFPRVVDAVADELADAVAGPSCAVTHVDGSMNAAVRARQTEWLKAPIPEGECRVLSNARCLSEGVDVPALDAVMFLQPRRSQVDIVQSVGRVMRKAPGKTYGYVILPVAVPAGTAPEEALKDNDRFRVVWDVLNALRSHDDRFEAMINTIDLDKTTGNKLSVEVIGSGSATDDDEPGTVRHERPGPTAIQGALDLYGQWRDSILARIVKKVGDREYWDAWASDVADIHANQEHRITAILNSGDHAATEEFATFLAGLQANLNDGIAAKDAVSMLSQHLITRPVFDALFPDHTFVEGNPVAQAMQGMLAVLGERGLDAETDKLEGFYASVRRRAAQISTPAGRQTVIHELYENFFRLAFAKQAASLGVVYTPVEIVDFILRMADDVATAHLGTGLSNAGVHVLDPFTGTGTFIVRLLQSGVIRPEDLARKYAGELWANEIMLLAYYIACVNIETTYQALRVQQTGADVRYQPFPGATLTDTFQITEDGDRADTSLIPANNARIERQLAAPITVIVGNPPYSAGQSSANDDNQNHKYPTLDARIAATYAARSTATNKNSLYDSYIRAFRWATDRLSESDGGIVAFVSNNGWVDGNTADGLRLTFAEEFSDVWVYNLRGNQRTAGELSRQEGGKVFGSGARTGVAVLVALKRPTGSGGSEVPGADHAGKGCRIHYFGVADYETREQKLAGIDAATLDSVPWREIAPNEDGDWLNQRNPLFETFPALGDEPGAYFHSHGRGVETTRDAWAYNFSAETVEANMRRMIDAYNEQAARHVTNESELDLDPTRISWSRNIRRRALAGSQESFNPNGLRRALYRPFTQQALYFDPIFNAVPGQNGKYFPTPHHENLGFYQVGNGSAVPFAVFMTDSLPDLHVTGAGSGGQFFPRCTYEKAVEDGTLDLGGGEVDEYGYRRVDNITDAIHAVYRERFGEVSKDQIFFSVYGVLHSPQYRETFAADLKRMLPRVPLAASREDFLAFAEAGKKLSDLHVGYESVEPYPLHEAVTPAGDDWETYRVEKLAWVDKTTESAIRVNRHVTLSDIPEAANRYMLGSRSALEWLIDRYRVKTDKASGIVNDPNDWAREHDDPRYIVDLIKRVTRVSVDTMAIVESLPALPLD